MKHIIHCPICKKKVDEREDLEEEKPVREYCDRCKINFWVIPQLIVEVWVSSKAVKTYKTIK